MKQITYVIVILCITAQQFVTAQELPGKPASGYAFPLGSKFTIKLYPTDSTHFNFSIIAFEHYTATVDTWEHDNLFPKAGQDSTVTFCFCVGTEGKTEQEKIKNQQVLLLIKNYTKINFQYSSDIQRTENGAFESTSNIGIFSKATGKEMWPYMIYAIGLKDFRRYQFPEKK